jgi:hypothetical protein
MLLPTLVNGKMDLLQDATTASGTVADPGGPAAGKPFGAFDWPPSLAGEWPFTASRYTYYGEREMPEIRAASRNGVALLLEMTGRRLQYTDARGCFSFLRCADACVRVAGNAWTIRGNELRDAPVGIYVSGAASLPDSDYNRYVSIASPLDLPGRGGPQSIEAACRDHNIGCHSTLYESPGFDPHRRGPHLGRPSECHGVCSGGQCTYSGRDGGLFARASGANPRNGNHRPAFPGPDCQTDGLSDFGQPMGAGDAAGRRGGLGRRQRHQDRVSRREPDGGRRWAGDTRRDGGVAIVTASHVPVRKGLGPARFIIAQLARGERVELPGFRSADGRWVQVALRPTPGGPPWPPRRPRR